MAKHPAIFLDRDGTIIEDTGNLSDPDNLLIYPFSLKALRNLQKHFLLFIITNQSGISKGNLTHQEVVTINSLLVNSLKYEKVTIYDVFYCPHSKEDNCNCRKPNPYFIHKAALKYNLDLDSSFIIGDHPSDALCGINAGVTPVYLRTGHGEIHIEELPKGVKICDNLLDATKYVLTSRKRRAQRSKMQII